MMVQHNLSWFDRHVSLHFQKAFQIELLVMAQHDLSRFDHQEHSSFSNFLKKISHFSLQNYVALIPIWDTQERDSFSSSSTNKKALFSQQIKVKSFSNQVKSLSSSFQKHLHNKKQFKINHLHKQNYFQTIVASGSTEPLFVQLLVAMSFLIRIIHDGPTQPQLV